MPRPGSLGPSQSRPSAPRSCTRRRSGRSPSGSRDHRKLHRRRMISPSASETTASTGRLRRPRDGGRRGRNARRGAHDPYFEPVVAVGAGGTTVELLRDVAVRVTPISDLRPTRWSARSEPSRSSMDSVVRRRRTSRRWRRSSSASARSRTITPPSLRWTATRWRCSRLGRDHRCESASPRGAARQALGREERHGLSRSRTSVRPPDVCRGVVLAAEPSFSRTGKMGQERRARPE